MAAIVLARSRVLNNACPGVVAVFARASQSESFGESAAEVGMVDCARA
jgi:hypothetical protein